MAIALAITPALAAEPVFPIGSRVGLVPPPGFTASKRVPGFEDADTNATIVLVTFPPQAFSGIEATMTPDVVKSQGMAEEKREILTLPNGKGLMVVGEAEEGGRKFRKWMFLGLIPEGTVLAAVQVPERGRSTYSDDVVRASLLTLAVRPMVPVEEVLELLPFKITDLSGMRPVRAVPSSGVYLTDGEKDSPLPSEQPMAAIEVQTLAAPPRLATARKRMTPRAAAMRSSATK